MQAKCSGVPFSSSVQCSEAPAASSISTMRRWLCDAARCSGRISCLSIDWWTDGRRGRERRGGRGERGREAAVRQQHLHDTQVVVRRGEVQQPHQLFVHRLAETDTGDGVRGEGGKEGRREGGREGGRDGGREGGRDGGREGGRD